MGSEVGISGSLRPVAVAACLALLTAPSVKAQAAPVIEHIEPTSGPPGTVVHIIGRRFGPGATAQLNGKPLPVVSSLPNRIVVRVPGDASSGRIELISTRGASTRGPEFRVTPLPPAPVIDGFEPTSGPPGSEVTVRGKNFSPRLTGNRVTIAGRPVVVKSATPVRLVLTVPELQGAGPILIRVRHAGDATSAQSFTVSAATAITAVSPASGPPGGEITIRGSGFSSTARDNRVYIHNTPLTVKSARADELTAVLPQKVASGTVLVDVRGGGRAQSAEPFVVQRLPTIRSFSPRRGAVGSVIQVRGTNFGTDPALVEARLGEAGLTVRSARRTRLELVVPEGATDDRISIRVSGVGPARSEGRFSVASSLKILRLQPSAGPAGSELTIEGEGFAPSAAQNRVKIGKRRARVLEATSTRLKVRVPRGKSGPVHVRVPGGSTTRTTGPFVITRPPKVRGVSPRRGPVGTELTLRGTGFGDNSAVLQVTLGGHPLEVTSVRDDVVVVRVTPGAPSGPLKVAIPLQGEHELSWQFQVEAAPK